MAKHTIRILNYNLTLTSDDDKTYIENIAKKVEQNIRSLSDAMPTRNMTEVSLFVAMDYCDRYMKAVGDGNSLRGQIKDYLKDASHVRQQLVEANKEIEKLREEIEQLKSAENLTKTEPSAVGSEDKTPQTFSAVREVSAASREFAAPAKDPVKESIFGKKKGSKNKKKENKQPPAKNFWGADTNSESADAAVDIMSFFENQMIDDDD